MKLKPLYIIGTSGFSKEVAQVASLLNSISYRWESIEYIAEGMSDAPGNLPFGKIAGDDLFLENLKYPADVAIGVGEPGIRKKIADRFQGNKYIHFPNIIHPQVLLDESVVQLGHGNFFACGSIVTCGIEIGNHNVINYTATIGHDCRIGSFNVVNPGANISGWVVIGDGCLIGTGAQILARTSIPSNTTIGASALVTKSITDSGTYMGVPARRA